jgi:hypothetical protein
MRANRDESRQSHEYAGKSVESPAFLAGKIVA